MLHFWAHQWGPHASACTQQFPNPKRDGGSCSPCIPFLLNCWLYGKHGGSQLRASRRERLSGALTLKQIPEQHAGGPVLPEPYRYIGCSLPKTLIPHKVQSNCRGSRGQEGCIYPVPLFLHRKPKGRISVTGWKCCFTLCWQFPCSM